MVKLDFISQLALCSREDVSFSIVCLNVLEYLKQFNLLMGFKKTRLVKMRQRKGINKRSNCENLVDFFSEIVQKIAGFAMLF